MTSFLIPIFARKKKKKANALPNPGNPLICISLLRVNMTCRNSNNNAIADVLPYIRYRKQKTRHVVYVHIAMYICYMYIVNN